jgi:ABC-type Fe3+ transport system permease subunit
MEQSPAINQLRVASGTVSGGLTKGHLLMAIVLVSLGYFLVWPVLLLLINSFNAANDWFVEPRVWGLAHWVNAFQRPGLLRSLGNSLLIWSLTVGISFPIGVTIAWLLARTKIPGSRTLEFLFWVSYMMPSLPTTIAWITLLDPDIGMINVALKYLFQLDQGPFNIFSVPGIVWANLMGHGISIKVMLMTPAFRNMDSTLEEAARVGGASNLTTLLRVTLPLMVSPMIMVFALQLLRVFQSFETEYLLGVPFGFYVYSTKVYALVRKEVETVNASLPAAQRIAKFLLLYKELDADDGELTRTRKVRRGVINEKYADIIEAIYAGKSEIDVDTVIRFQDGATQRIRTKLAVVDLEPGPAPAVAMAAE